MPTRPEIEHRGGRFISAARCSGLTGNAAGAESVVMKRPQGPVPTLGQLQESTSWMWSGANHLALMLFAPLIARWGAKQGGWRSREDSNL
jgi:hypothetical protein